jgi:hypothetical protein
VVPLATPYFAFDIINGLQRDTSVASTPFMVANLLREKLTAQFRGFDIIPQSGVMKRELGHQLEDDPITNFTIAAYDGAVAHVYQVGVGVNWVALTHRISPVATLYPDDRKHLSLSVAGYSDAIQDIWKQRSSPNTQRFASSYPDEYRALLSDLDLSMDRMVVLARALLAVQIERTPTFVSYPLTVVTVPASGPIARQSYGK